MNDNCLVCGHAEHPQFQVCGVPSSLLPCNCTSGRYCGPDPKQKPLVSPGERVATIEGFTVTSTPNYNQFGEEIKP